MTQSENVSLHHEPSELRNKIALKLCLFRSPLFVNLKCTFKSSSIHMIKNQKKNRKVCACVYV